MTLNLIQLGSKNVSQTLQIIKYKCDIAKWEWQTSITYMLVCSMYATTTSNDIFEHNLDFGKENTKAYSMYHEVKEVRCQSKQITQFNIHVMLNGLGL